MSGEAVGGGGGKPSVDDNDTRRSTRLLLITAGSRQQTLTTCFAGDGGYWTASLSCLWQWMAFVVMHEFYYIGDRRHYYGRFRSSPLESATIWFRSDNRPFFNSYCVLLTKVVYLKFRMCRMVQPLIRVSVARGVVGHKLLSVTGRLFCADWERVEWHL